MLGDDSTGNNLICPLLFFITLLSKFTLASVHNAFLQLSFLDGSEEEERARLATKEEEDVDILWSWMEVGGLLAHPEEEVKGLLAEVNSSPVFPMLPSSLHLLFVTSSPLTILALDCYWLFPPSF